MKKILLMMVVFVATFSAFAEDKDEDFWGGWDDSFKPVAADKTPTPVIAQAGDGSVYVAVQRGVEFIFAGKAVPAPEIDGSGVIVKYDKDGKEQWAVTLDGAATVRALAADKDGTLYATGSFLDEVDYTGTDAVKGTIKSFGAVSAFVAKVSKDGKFEAMKTFEPAGNLEIVLSEFPFYLPDEDPIDITPNNIQIDGDKVYVSATYKGDVEEIGWKGAYAVNYDFGMYFDNASAGVFSLNKSDLSGAANVAYVQATGTISETQNYPEALNFVVDNGTAYVGFFGFGNLTITTPAGSKDFITFASDGEGMNEHGFVLATVGSALTTKVFDAEKHDKIAKPYKVMMGLAGDNVIIGGTFYGALPFDNTLTSGEVGKDGDGDVTYSFASAAFVTSVKKDGAVNWANATAVECKGVVMVVTGDEIHAATDKGTVIFETATGELEADEYDDGDPVIADASAWEDEYATLVLTDENEVYVISKDMKSDNTVIEDIDAPVAEDGQLFNILGQPVDENYKGVAITADGKKMYMK